MTSKTSRASSLATHVALLSLALGALACTETEAVLFVDVIATYSPGTEFDRVEVELLDTGGAVVEAATITAADDDDFLAGIRVAEFTGLGSGDYRLTGRLSLAGEVVATRRLSIPLFGSVGVTVPFQAPACVIAPEICNGVDDDCDGDVDEVAGDAEAPLCALDAVAESACVGGRCEVVSCAESRDDCDGDAASGCEANLRDDDASCGGCGVVCDASLSCERAACRGRGRYVAHRVFEGRPWPGASLVGGGVVLTSGPDILGFSPDLDEVFRVTLRTVAGPSPYEHGGSMVRDGTGRIHVLYDLNNSSNDAPSTLHVEDSSGGGDTVEISVPARRRLEFVIHLAPDGTLEGVSQVPDIFERIDMVRPLSPAPEGYLLSAAGRPSFDPGEPSESSPLVISFTASGEERWRRSYPDARILDFRNPQENRIWHGGLVGTDGNVVVWAPRATNAWSSFVDFGGGEVLIAPEMGVLASYDEEGELVWLERLSGTVVTATQGPEGLIYVLVETKESAPVKSQWVEVRAPDGELLETREGPLFGSRYINLAAGPRGDLYVAHALTWPTDFGGGRRAPLLPGPALVSYDASGAYRYDLAYTEPGTGNAQWVGAVGDHVILFGTFTGRLDLTPDVSIETERGNDYYLLSLRD